MIATAIKRTLVTLTTLLGIAISAFLFVRLLPGDPITYLAGERNLPENVRAELVAHYGLDQPIWIQFSKFLLNALRGDLGQSITTGNSVSETFALLFPATAELAIISIVISILIGLPLGILAATKKGTLTDHITMTGALVGYSMPVFWWGLILIVIFSGALGWTPVSGRIDFAYTIPQYTGLFLLDAVVAGDWRALRSAISHLILPSLVLATVPLAVIARQTRSAMLEVLGEDYIRTAKAKGLISGRIIFKHALRNALIPVVTTVGLQVSVLFTGAVLTETIFSWPGVGKWMVDSIFRRDYPAVQGGILLLALIIMIVNTIVDIVSISIDPRIRGSIR